MLAEKTSELSKQILTQKQTYTKDACHCPETVISKERKGKEKPSPHRPAPPKSEEEDKDRIVS